MNTELNIGNKIRDLRNKNGLTQQELADRVELTKSFISQIENEATIPSITTLVSIVECLGSNLSDFFYDEKEDGIVYREDDYFEKEDVANKSTVQWLVPNAQKNMMEPIRVEIRPGGKTVTDKPHEGEEFGYVLQGAISLHIGEDVYRVKAGESFYYRSDKEHYIEAEKKGKAVLLWISTPPSF